MKPEFTAKAPLRHVVGCLTGCMLWPCMILLLAVVGTVTYAAGQTAPTPTMRYAAIQKHLARGWNTWDTHSVMTQVLLPEGLAVRIGVYQRSTEGSNSFLRTALIGESNGEFTHGSAHVYAGPHAYDGSYTDMKLEWHGYQMRIQSAHDGNDLVMLVTPLAQNPHLHLAPEIVFSVDVLWNRPGLVSKADGAIKAAFSTHDVHVYLSGKDTHDVDVPLSGPYFTSVLDRPVGLSTGRPRTIQEIQGALDREADAYQKSISTFGHLAPVAGAIQDTVGWDTIYDPEGRRVITPVSRNWNVSWGGYVLFDWDTFFTATLASVGDRDLAYANAVEILREETPEGFVPNYARAHGWKSSDRSEPPVGSITVLGLYQKFHDKWLLQLTFSPLLRWNRWWNRHRSYDGYLVWGSDGQNQPRNLDDSTAGTRTGAILESGLDNSPMYDHAVYNSAKHQLEYADVGLMSMYIADCNALAKIATILGQSADAASLEARARKYGAKLETMWNPKLGIFLNLNLHNGESNLRLSPTNFYPMLADVATQAQAERMVKEHLLNPKQFWGKWVIPSIERSDPAFKDQDYWRGRIWGPMNYLVYLGLQNYHSPLIDRARADLAKKSLALFLKGWKGHRHVCENYNAITGAGDDVRNSDRFYTWGALLGMMSLPRKQAENAFGK